MKKDKKLRIVHRAGSTGKRDNLIIFTMMAVALVALLVTINIVINKADNHFLIVEHVYRLTDEKAIIRGL